MKKYVIFGKIIKTHGLKGEVVVDCNFDDYRQFEQKLHIKAEKDLTIFPVKVTGSLSGNRIIIKSAKVDTFEDAKRLINKDLFVLREDLPPPQQGHYVCDLMGLQVVSAESGKVFGIVTDVVDFGSGMNLEIKNLQEKLEYYVYDDTVVVDLESDTIKVKLQEYV